MEYLTKAEEYLRTTVPLYVVLVLFVVWYVLLNAFRTTPSARREPQMDPNARMTKIRGAISDGLLHRVLLPMLQKGEITGEEFDYFCKRFRDQSKLSIVWRRIIKPFSTYRLKAEIKRRLPEHKIKPTIPGDPPPDLKTKSTGNGKLQITMRT